MIHRATTLTKVEAIRRYALRVDHWDLIASILPRKPGDIGVTAKDNRLFVEAVGCGYRAGIAWRDLPKRFGDFRVIHKRHMRRSRKNVWSLIFKALTEDADNEYAMIDTTIVQTHQYAAGAKVGQTQGMHWQIQRWSNNQNPRQL